MSVGSLIGSGPLLLAMPVAAAAGAVTFLSPCVLPLVPGYLSYITGMSGAAVSEADDAGAGDTAARSGEAGGRGLAARDDGRDQPAGAVVTAVTPSAAVQAATMPARRRAVAGAALFVLGFAAFGGVSVLLRLHGAGLSRVLGVVLIALGLLFAGAFDRFSFAGRIVKPSARPRIGLAGAPLLGVLFGLGWTPCIGPTLTAVLTLTLTTGTAARGAALAFVYALGVGVPFLLMAFAVDRGVSFFGFARRHARLITRIGGAALVAVGLLEVTGAWASAIRWLQVHWVNGYNAPF